MTLTISKPPEWASMVRGLATLAVLLFLLLHSGRELYSSWKYERDKREVKKLQALFHFMAMRGTPMPSLLTKARKILERMERDL